MNAQLELVSFFCQSNHDGDWPVINIEEKNGRFFGILVWDSPDDAKAASMLSKLECIGHVAATDHGREHAHLFKIRATDMLQAVSYVKQLATTVFTASDEPTYWYYFGEDIGSPEILLDHKDPPDGAVHLECWGTDADTFMRRLRACSLTKKVTYNSEHRTFRVVITDAAKRDLLATYKALCECHPAAS